MGQHVLVPYDGSDQSADALAYALAAFPADEVTLLHVIEPVVEAGEPAVYTGNQYEQRRENAETMLENARSSQEEADRIGTATTFGRPVHELLGYTRDNAVDHIVMGSHGRDGAARLLLGSVAETVVRRSPVPVTVVRHGQDRIEQPTDVLVPFDGSTQSRQALAYALDRYGEAQVTAVYVLYPPGDTLPGTTHYGVGTGQRETWEEKRHEQTAEVLETTSAVTAEYDRDVETAEIEGEPAEAIVQYLEENEFDHVVIGSTGRDGLSRLLLGSVAETVVRRSPVSVTVSK